MEENKIVEEESISGWRGNMQSFKFTSDLKELYFRSLIKESAVIATKKLRRQLIIFMFERSVKSLRPCMK